MSTNDKKRLQNVSWHKASAQWRASIQIQNKRFESYGKSQAEAVAKLDLKIRTALRPKAPRESSLRVLPHQIPHLGEHNEPKENVHHPDAVLHFATDSRGHLLRAVGWEMNEGRKPKLTWVEVRLGVFVPTESADIQVKANLEGRYHAFGDELSEDPYFLWGADNLLDAKVACEEWLEDKIRTYFPAARALGMLEAEE